MLSKKKGEIPAKKPIKGDRVTFKYRIEDLNQNLLYDEDQLGIVSLSSVTASKSSSA